MGELNFMLGNTMPDPTRTVDMTAFNKGLNDYAAQLAAQKAEEKKIREQARGRMERAINQLGSVENIEKIPSVYQPGVNKFLMQGKNDYYEAAKLLSQSEVGSDQYISAVETMNRVNQGFKNLDMQLKSLAQRKADAIKDFDGGLISNGNQAGDVEWLTHMYTDGLPMQISEGGQLYFQKGDAFVSMDDAPDYFLKDSKASKGIIDLNSKVYNSGIEDNEQTRNMVKMQVRQIVEQGGRETALSLATDDNIYPGGLGILDNSLLIDESRTSELSQLVVDKYTDMIMEAGKQGNSDRVKRAAATRAPRSSRSGSSSSPSVPNYLDPEQLSSVSIESIAPLRSLKSTFDSNPAALRGLVVDGKPITNVEVLQNGVEVQALVGSGSNASVVTKLLKWDEPQMIVNFIGENFAELTGMQRNTTQGRELMFYLNAWVYKKKFGNAKGYSPTGNLPVPNK